MANLKLWIIPIVFYAFCTPTVHTYLNNERSCRCFPADPCWPSDFTWQALNRSVHGRLVATLPLGAPCHDPIYNSDICKNFQNHWLEPVTQWEQPLPSLDWNLWDEMRCEKLMGKLAAMSRRHQSWPLSGPIKAAIPSNQRLDLANWEITFVMQSTLQSRQISPRELLLPPRIGFA